jgi:serine phosphatase RsbU (regulator of sigma subunit)
LPLLLLLAAAAGRTILPAAPFPNSALIVLALFLFARNYLSAEASPFDITAQIRRFRRSVWLLIPLAGALFGLRQIMETAAALPALIFLEIIAFSAALFLLLALFLQLMRFSPEHELRHKRIIFGGVIAAIMVLFNLVGEIQFLIYFLLGIWALSFSRCAHPSFKSKLGLTVFSLIALILLIILPLESVNLAQPMTDASLTQDQLEVSLFDHLPPIAAPLILSLRRALMALLIVLPGKVLLRPLADWLRQSLRIRNKLLLSYFLSGIVPGLLLVILLFFGVLFLLGGYYQRFINQIISTRADALTLVLTPDSTALHRQLDAQEMTLARFPTIFDSVRTPAEIVGRALFAPLAMDSTVKEMARDGFSGLAAIGDSLYLTQWLTDQNQIIALFRPFRYDDLQELKDQCGVNLTLLPYENVHSKAESKYDIDIDAERSTPRIRTVTDSDSGVTSIFTGLPVLIPSVQISSSGDLDLGQRMLTVQISPRSIYTSLFGSGYLINRLYLIAFVILTGIFGAILILVALMGFGLAGSITRSIGRLSRGTQRLSDGDLSVRIEVESKDELGELAGSFNLMVADLNRMLVEIKEKERLEGELEAARSIQMKLLPQELPHIAGYDIAAASLSAKQVGGDYYDFLRLDSNWVSFLVGDVSGKGMPAALLMANLQASLHTLSELHRKPRELLSRLNRVLHANTAPEMFATFFFALLDADNGRLRYINAGHNNPIVCGDGRVEQLSVGGLPLGILPDVEYEEGRVEIRRGELLALYSDGIVEAMNAQDQEFGEERLIRILQGHCEQSAQEILQTVVRDVESFAGTPQDDVTLVVIKRL